MNHFFGDHQRCLKCGKPETAPEAEDCVVSDEEYDALISAGKQPAWRESQTKK